MPSHDTKVQTGTSTQGTTLKLESTKYDIFVPNETSTYYGILNSETTDSIIHSELSTTDNSIQDTTEQQSTQKTKQLTKNSSIQLNTSTRKDNRTTLEKFSNHITPPQQNEEDFSEQNPTLPWDTTVLQRETTDSFEHTYLSSYTDSDITKDLSAAITNENENPEALNNSVDDVVVTILGIVGFVICASICVVAFPYVIRIKRGLKIKKTKTTNEDDFDTLSVDFFFFSETNTSILHAW